MLRNSEYWKQRFDQVEQAANNKSVKYTKQLEKKYQRAAQQLDKQINAWYQRIAVNNEVTITEAKRLLSASELKEFKWTVEEYIEYGRQNAVDQSWMKELENASAKFHINRLEALKLEARQQVEQLFAGGQQSMFDTLADIYKETFYRSCFEIQKGIGVGFDVSKLDDKQVSRLLMKPWSVDGTNFSEKLWGNKKKLINILDQELSRMVLTGESPQKIIANIRKEMNTSQYAAKRLVFTEQAYFTSIAQKDSYGELDVEEYEFVGTLDGKTCDDCGELDGKHFPVSDMQSGINAAPMHPFCRCTTCPYFNDEFTVGERIARDEKGEYYHVPENMTFKEWKKSFIKDDENLEKSTDNDTMGARTNTGKLVFFNENNDYSINIEGLSERVNEKLSLAAKSVAQKGSDDGYEHMYLVDLSGELEIYEETNEMFDAVGLKFWKYAEAHSEVQFAFIHNHNTDSSLSQTDLETPILCENIPIQIAVRNDGVKYVAKRKKLAPDGYYPDFYFESKLKDINEKSRNGELTAIERMREREKIIINALTEEFYEGIEILDGRK